MVFILSDVDEWFKFSLLIYSNGARPARTVYGAEGPMHRHPMIELMHRRCWGKLLHQKELMDAFDENKKNKGREIGTDHAACFVNVCTATGRLLSAGHHQIFGDVLERQQSLRQT